MDRKTFTIYQADSLECAKGGGMSLRNCRLELSGKIVQRPEVFTGFARFCDIPIMKEMVS
jgi:hypothetical protein